MLPERDTKELSDYIVRISDKKIKHKYYDKAVKHHEEMEVHVDGEKPTRLLEINRPNEPADVKEYRLKVYKPITKSSCDKVVNTVNRIFNPRLYRIEYKDNPSRIKDGQGLEEYMTEDYPFYLSVMNYISEVGLRQIFSDPNGIIVVWPKSMEVSETDFYQPIPKYIESEEIMDFEDEKYYTWVDEDDYKCVYILDEVSKRKYEIQIRDGKSDVVLTEEIPHGMGTPPAFRIGGIIKGNKAPYYYESFISGVLPHWDKVVTMTSDLDGSIVNHLYMESYEWQVDCDESSCKGGYTEKKIDFGPDAGKMAKYECHRCKGTGKITSRGPFGQLTINRDALNPDSPIPLPPKDYIKKDIEPVRELRDLIKEQLQAGFSAINMEILAKVGEDQSGVAKTIDRQDLDSFLLRVSNHVFKYFLPNLIYYTAEWRYRMLLDRNVLMDYLPTIHPPKDFSVLSINELMAEYQEASNSKVSQYYLRRLEEEIANTKFGNNEMERLKNLAIIRLNPFPSKSADDLLTDLSSGSIRKEDWIKANYIELLVNKAIAEDEEFLSLTLIEKDEALNEIIARDYTIATPTMIEPAGTSV